MKLLLISVFSTLLFSCFQKKDQNKGAIITNSNNQHSKKIEINYIGSVQFVKSYSFIQSPTLSEKQIDELSKKTEKSYPAFVNGDSALKKLLTNIGMVEGNYLLLDADKKANKWINKFSGKKNFNFTNYFGKKIKLSIIEDTITPVNGKLIVQKDLDTISVRISLHPPEDLFGLMDILAGSNPEFIIVNLHYLANAYIYTLEVYEIKT